MNQDFNDSDTTIITDNKDSHKQPEKQSWWFRVVSFLSLTDSEILADCGRYDRMLAYAMVFRQLVTFVFTFLLFTYGVSLFLGTVGAVISGFIFALTLFFLDQAIIGSDWALKNPFKGGLPIKSLIGLIPRIIYSLIIAIGLATLAEVSLQSSAIDEQIQKEAHESNKEYFARLKAYEKELDMAIDVDKNRLSNLQSQISVMRKQVGDLKVAEQSGDPDVLQNNLSVKATNLSELQKSQQVLIREVAEINEQIANARKEYNYWFNEALLERTGKDGRAPTEGPKYKRAVKTYTDLETQIASLETSLQTAKNKLANLSPNIDSATAELNQVQQQSNQLTQSEVNYENSSQTLKELEQRIAVAKAELNDQIAGKQLKLDQYRQTLESDGLFYEVKTGFLRRYLGLKSIHADPEVGEAATLFSLLLKIFFIAIELMPVIIKLFFSPFSFYSLKMYRKMHIALLEEQTALQIAEEHHMQLREKKLKEAKEQKMDTISL